MMRSTRATATAPTMVYGLKNYVNPHCAALGHSARIHVLDERGAWDVNAPSGRCHARDT